jgi:hypothetical protein
VGFVLTALAAFSMVSADLSVAGGPVADSNCSQPKPAIPDAVATCWSAGMGFSWRLTYTSSDPGNNNRNGNNGNNNNLNGSGPPAVCSLPPASTVGSAGTQVVPCSTANGWFSTGADGAYCYYQAAPNGDPSNPAYAGAWAGHTSPPTGAIYLATCYERAYNSTYLAWVLQPPKPVWLDTPPPGVAAPVTPFTLVETAFADLDFAKPTIEYSPRLIGSKNASVVNAHTWYWTDPDTIKPPPDSKTHLQAGPVTAVIIVTPTLTIDPGDGSAAITCTGGGTEPPAGTALQTTPSPSGCDHVYSRTSVDAPNQAFAATYTLTWTITYTGTGVPTPVPFATITESSAGAIPVVQIQSLVVAGN